MHLQGNEIQHVIIQHPKTAGSLQNKLRQRFCPQGVHSLTLGLTQGSKMTRKKIGNKNDKCYIVPRCACQNDCSRYFKYNYFLCPLSLLMLPVFFDSCWCADTPELEGVFLYMLKHVEPIVFILCFLMYSSDPSELEL